MSTIKKIILTAMMLALFIVFNRFLSIKTPILIISLQYIPLMMTAIWLGPKYSTLIGALGDFIGAIFFPIGAYFPGFTFDCAISGTIYGLFLNNSHLKNNPKKFIINLIISSILVLIVINIFIASLWIHLIYGKAYLVVLSSRAITQIIMIPIQVISIYEITKITTPYTRKYLYNELQSDEEE